MCALRLNWVLNWLVLLTGMDVRAMAQNLPTCCNDTPPVLLPRQFSNAGRWRLMGGLGASVQYQRQRSDQSLHLDRGLQANISTDYFLGRHWGLGFSAGHQSLAVRQQYVQLVYQDASVPATMELGLLPEAGLQSLYAVVGPALSLPLARRLTIDMSIRGGIFYNNAPVVGAFEPAQNQLVFRISPNDQRFSPGVIATGHILYRLNPRWQIGVGGSGTYSRFSYTVERSNGRFYRFLRQLGVISGQVSVVYTLPGRTPPMAPALPTCYPPLLDSSVPGRYELGVDARPVLKWRSSAPVYTDDERYLVRLFQMPGNRLLAETTVRGEQWAWPANVALPDTSSLFFYSVQTTRTDYVEQTCRSELATGTLEFFKRIAVVPPSTRSDAPTLTVELFEIQPLSMALPVATSVRRSRQTLRKRTDRSGRLAKQAPADEAAARTGLMEVREQLIYREITRNPDLAWPTGVPYPAKPTMYRYVVKKTGDITSLPVGDYTLLASPGGNVKVLTAAEKKARLAVPKPGLAPKPKLIKKRNNLRKSSAGGGRPGGAGPG